MVGCKSFVSTMRMAEPLPPYASHDFLVMCSEILFYCYFYCNTRAQFFANCIRTRSLCEQEDDAMGAIAAVEKKLVLTEKRQSVISLKLMCTARTHQVWRNVLINRWRQQSCNSLTSVRLIQHYWHHLQNLLRGDYDTSWMTMKVRMQYLILWKRRPLHCPLPEGTLKHSAMYNTEINCETLLCMKRTSENYLS
jgi:hypothetical protein